VIVEEFSPEQHKTWAELYRRQIPRIEKFACAEYLAGFPILDLPAEEVPTVDYLNSRITPATGWTIERTTVRYTDADEWYRKFDQKIFLITDYMRSWEELDWTPEPDMFHDVFGHLPFMVLPEYAEMQEMFAPTYLRATDAQQKENIKRLAWFSAEFGLIREGGEVKIFGTGLMSGGDEMEKAAAGATERRQFTIENVLTRDKAVNEQNEVLFVFDSLDAVKAELARYFDTI
jgi:phenylalanine-4-hydroxylase